VQRIVGAGKKGAGLFFLPNMRKNGSDPISPMHFEHLIQINDPRLALVELLSRQQLWLGLVHRGRSPAVFARGLECSTVDSESRDADITTLNRTLDFGGFRVRDRVQLVEGSHIVITAVATEQWPQSTLSIAIEEPAPELLFLRFIYAYPDADFGQPEDRLVAELRRQAYEQSDIDSVVRIREMAANGALGDYAAPHSPGYGTLVPQ
jgi:hypothetical protein